MILRKGTIKVAGVAAANTQNKKVICKNSSSFTDCISKIKNVPVDNAKDLDKEIPMYNLLEYSNN